MTNIENLCQSTLTILIRDIMELNIIIPILEFSYDANPNIKYGYYMYQNSNSNIITLNMKMILGLKVIDDIKTVVTYGFIHEIFHMFQNIKTDYFKDMKYHNLIEDCTDYDTIYYIRDNLNLIENRLNFKFNLSFLSGIERQLEHRMSSITEFEDNEYVINVISGTLFNRININYDYIRSILSKYTTLNTVFPDGRNYYISLLGYDSTENLNLLIHLINIHDFKFIHIREEYYNQVVAFYLY